MTSTSTLSERDASYKIRREITGGACREYSSFLDGPVHLVALRDIVRRNVTIPAGTIVRLENTSNGGFRGIDAHIIHDMHRVTESLGAFKVVYR
jgi:hypothetical protein